MKKETVEDLYRNLQQSFDHWHILYTQGGSDPFWADGVNLNLVRNHILHYRKRIDELSPDETRRELYHRELPPSVESEYMANPEEIRQKAKASLQKLEQDENYRYLRRKEKTLTPKQIEAANIHYLVMYVQGIRTALEKDDLVTLRRAGDVDWMVKCVEERAEQVRQMKPPENEQLSLFAFLEPEDDLDDEAPVWEPQF